MPQKRDYYEILGVGRDSSEDQIKKAYRKLAMQYHPDRNPDDKAAEEKFKEASEAYHVLSDSERRAQYDRFGHAAFEQGAGAGGFDFSSIFEDSVFGDQSIGDFFGGGRRSRSMRGDDLRYDLEIEFEEAVQASRKSSKFLVSWVAKIVMGAERFRIAVERPVPLAREMDRSGFSKASSPLPRPAGSAQGRDDHQRSLPEL